MNMNLELKISCRATLSTLAFTILLAQGSFSAALPIVENVEWQPLAAKVNRLIETTDYLGSPFSTYDKHAIETALKESSAKKLQEILDRHCLFLVSINPEMRVKVAAGPAKPELVEQGWRQFLVKVINDSGTTAALQAVSPNAVSVYSDEGGGPKGSASDQFYRENGRGLSLADNADLWLELKSFVAQPLGKSL